MNIFQSFLRRWRMYCLELKMQEAEKKAAFHFRKAKECMVHIDTLRKWSGSETKGAFNKRMVDIVTQPDLTTCPGCGEYANNGHSRDLPPAPYYCTKCETPESHGDSGAKSDEPQNPDINP